MKQARRWLLAAPDKQPFYVDGTPRRGKLDTPEDQACLVTYEAAQTALASKGERWHLGFALGPDGGGYWQGIDLDKIEANSLGALADMLPGYVERSPSGTGLHAIGYGRPFRSLGPNTSGVEAYSSKRFFVVTGDMIRHNGLGCVADFVERELAGWHGSAVPNGVLSTMAEPTALQLASRELLVTPQLVSELRSALSCIPADDYGLWIRMGHAIKTLGDAGRDLWHDWSATSEKYDPEQAEGKWVSFAPDETGYAAIFAEAKRGGWVNPAAATDNRAPRLSPLPSIISATDLAKMRFPALRWAIPDTLPEGLALLAGKPKAGKSFFAMQMCLAVSSGDLSAFGGGQGAGGDVLYCALEDSYRRLQERLFRMSLGVIPDRLQFATIWPIIGEGCVEMLDDWFQSAGNPRLVVIDTLRAIKPASKGSQQAYDQDANTLAPLLDFVRSKSGLTCLVIHHIRKMEADDPFDTISGTHGLTGVCDTLMVLRNHPLGGATLFGQGRDLEPFERALERDLRTGGWIVSGNAAPIAKTGERQALLNLVVAASEPLSLAELARATGKSPDGTRHLLKGLIDEGHIYQPLHGLYAPSLSHQIPQFTQEIDISIF